MHILTCISYYVKYTNISDYRNMLYANFFK